MVRPHSITSIITIVASLNFCFASGDAQSDSHDKRTTDFGINGGFTTQNFNFLVQQPMYFSQIKSKLTTKYFLTRHEGKTIAESYSFQLEGTTLNELFGLFAGGLIIEYEGDLPIKNDPLLHLTGFTESTFYEKITPDNGSERFAKGGLGLWVEGQQLGKKLQCSNDSDCSRYRTGLRAHLDIKWKWFSMLFEYLPHLTFTSHDYRLSASPEVEIEICEFWGRKLSIVFMGEIDYYSETSDLTIEPLFDVTKPFEFRWTYLFRPGHED